MSEIPADDHTVDSIPVLEYPRVIYVHSFGYRSWRGFGFLAFSTALTLAALCPAVWAPASVSSRLAVIVSAMICGIATTVVGIRILNHSKDVFRFTTVGIEARGKFVPWSDVSRVGANGMSSSQTVQLFYTVQRKSGWSRNHLVSAVGEGITAKEYEQMVETLKKELSASYPKLELGGYFSVET